MTRLRIARLFMPLLLLLCALSNAAQAQRYYHIESVLPRAGQRGTNVDVVIRGVTMGDPREIVFYRPGIRCTAIGPVTGILSDAGKPVTYGLAHGGKIAEEVRCRFEIADDCPLGEHPFHIRNDAALTMLNTFNVTPFACVEEGELRLNTNDVREKAVDVPLFTTVRGTIRQNTVQNVVQDVDVYRVPVRGSTRLSAELNIAQITDAHVGASEVDMAMRFLDENGRELAANDDSGLHVQDPILSIMAPTDGFIYIEVKQSTFTPISGAAFGLGGIPYTLHIGPFRRPLAAYPPGGQVGETLKVKFFDGTQRDSVQTVALPAEPGSFEYFGDAPSPLTLRVSPYPNVLENEKGATTAVASLPAALNGIVEKPGDADTFRLPAVKKGDRLHVRVFASALGAPLDPIVRLRPIAGDGKPGDVETESDDATLSERDIFGHYPRSGGGLKDVLDPSFVWTPKRDGEYELEIADTAGDGSPSAVYRVEIEPATDGVACTMFTQGQYVARGGSRGFNIRVEPLQGNAYTGPIQIVAKGLPEGVTFSSPPIPAGTPLPLLTWPGVLTCSSSVEPSSGFFELEARPVDTSRTLRSSFQWRASFIVQTGGDAFHLVRLRKMALAVTEPAPYELEVGKPSTALVANGELAIPVKIRRREGFTTPITLDALWLPFGVGKAAALNLEAGQTEAVLNISAAANARLGTWPFTVDAWVDFGPKFGIVHTGTPIVDLVVAQPFVELATPLESLRRGERKRYVWSVKSKSTFDGSATVKLLGLPKGVTQIGETPRITKETTQVAFEIEATDDALLGPVGGVACEVVLQASGQEIHQRSGNATLRIDPKL